MPDLIKIIRKVDRKSYLKGEFKGQFVGSLDLSKSDLNHEVFYNLELLSGRIFANRSNILVWEAGEDEEFRDEELFLTSIPDPVELVVQDDNNLVYYQVSLQSAKLKNYQLTNQQYEGKQVYGDITGEISGFLLHYDGIEEEVLVYSEEEKRSIADENAWSEALKLNTIEGYLVYIDKFPKGRYVHIAKAKIRELRPPTVAREDRTKSSFTWLDLLSTIFKIISFSFALILLIPLLFYGWWFIALLLIGSAILYSQTLLGPIVQRVWRVLSAIIVIGFLLFLVFALFSVFSNSREIRERPKVDNYEYETEKTYDMVDAASNPIISHHRVWEDYTNEIYEADIAVYRSDILASKRYREGNVNNIYTINDYDNLISNVIGFDSTKLGLVYNAFDSIGTARNLSRIEFANMIVSCIQDIPYRLILESDCNADLYEDLFVSEYLNEGLECVGNVKYGFYSPSEFIGTLIGDCDTRTILLFTILDHYNYDVAILSSNVYRHSILGINLPIPGKSKQLGSRRYVVWEATSRGYRGGELPSNISDMNNWHFSLTSNKKVT